MSDPQQAPIIARLDQLITQQQETNTLLRRIVPDNATLGLTLYDLLLGALFRPVVDQDQQVTFRALTEELFRLLQGGAESDPTAAQQLDLIATRLFGIGNSAALTAEATVDTFSLLFNQLSPGTITLNVPEQLNAIRENTAALTTSTDGSIVALLTQIADCACADTPPPQEAPPETCPLAFRSLNQLEWFNPAGLELVDVSVEFPANPGILYNVWAVIMPQVISTAKNVSISPVSGGNEVPNIIDPRPVAFRLYGSENNALDQYGFAMAWCGQTGISADSILSGLLGAGFMGLDGQIGGAAERNEFFTQISDNFPFNASQGTDLLVATGIDVGLPGRDGTPVASDTDNGILEAAVIYIALEDNQYSFLQAEDIRTSIYLGFYE